MTYIGDCYVDAGLIWIGDPCYVMGSDSDSGVDKWCDFCDKLHATPHGCNNYSAPLGAGTGLAITSGYGDGRYPVHIKKNHEGRVISATITFIGEEDEGW
jgi:hypothetical protein